MAREKVKPRLWQALAPTSSDQSPDRSLRRVIQRLKDIRASTDDVDRIRVVPTGD
jgi:hypothetical protein